MSKHNNDKDLRYGTSIDLAAEYLRQGKIVAFPTETYYGLAVDAENDESIKRLFEIKKRPSNKPLILLIESVSQLQGLASSIPEPFHSLMEKYWPGPLTLIFPSHTKLSKKLTAESGTIGIRISPHPVASQLVKKFGGPITATSANISGIEPVSTADEVRKMFGADVDYILDGGTSEGGLCSTVVGESDGRLVTFRKGPVMINNT